MLSVPPTLLISGESTVFPGEEYRLDLAAQSDLPITSWEIRWGDAIQTIAGNPSSVPHVYATPRVAAISASATVANPDGTTETVPALVSAGGSPQEVFVPPGIAPPGVGTINGGVKMTFGPDDNPDLDGLYVSVRAGDEVRRYNRSTGEFIDTVLNASFGGLDEPRGLEFGPDGSLYVVSNGTNKKILRYDGQTFETFIDLAEMPSRNPDFAWGPDANGDHFEDIYVGSYSRIAVFDGDTGNHLGDFELPDTGLILDLTFRNDGWYVAVSQPAEKIVRLDASGNYLGEFVPAWSGVLDDPNSFAFGPDGDLYVVSQAPGTVLRYDGVTGDFLETFVASGVLDRPSGLVFGSDGKLYVGSSEPGTDMVVRYAGPFEATQKTSLQVNVLDVTTAPSTDVPRAISYNRPNNNPAVSTLYVDTSMEIRDLNVSLDIDHSYGRDLVAYLTSPSGTRVTLFDNVGSSGGFHGTVLDDEAVLSIRDGTNPFADTFRTESLLSAFDGQNAQGTWTLEIIDEFSKNNGTLNGWSIEIAGVGPGSSLSIDDRTVDEDEDTVTFNVTLSQSASMPVSVNYSIASGTAAAGSDFDFTAAFGTLTFNAGETSKQVTVSILADEIPELDETFYVKLWKPSPGIIIADGQGLGTILENDPVTSPVPPPRGLLSWWKAEGNAQDSGPLAVPNDGTLMNGAAYGEGRVGQKAFTFDGVDDRFEAAANSLPTGNSDRTIELWVKADALPTSGEAFFAGYGNFGSFDQTYHLGTSGSRLFFSQWGNAIWGPDLLTGQWYHVAVTNVGNFATLYLNGAEVARGLLTINTPASSKFYMGRIPGALGDTRKLDGQVDEASVYNRALSSTEIVSIYKAGALGKADLPPSFSIADVTVTEAGSVADITVRRSGDLSQTVWVDYSTADGTAIAGNEYTASSGTLTFLPGQISKTIPVGIIDDTIAEPAKTFYVNLSLNPSNPSPDAAIVDGQGSGTILDNDVTTRFYVVDDGASDRTYEYGVQGYSAEDYALNSANTSPRGAASSAAGSLVWVVDANKKVYVYNTTGSLQGSWTPGSLPSNAQLEGIATNGTDVWLADNASDRVYRYAGAAGRTSGKQNAASSFVLAGENANPKDMVTDGTHFWVVNDGSEDKVFKYTLAGTLVGSWTIDTANSSPTGITIDPTANVANPRDIWIVDNVADRVFQYSGATAWPSVDQPAPATFILAGGNTNPQGIADPPPANARLAPAAVQGRSSSASLEAFVAEAIRRQPSSQADTRSRLSGALDQQDLADTEGALDPQLRPGVMDDPELVAAIVEATSARSRTARAGRPASREQEIRDDYFSDFDEGFFTKPLADEWNLTSSRQSAKRPNSGD